MTKTTNLQPSNPLREPSNPSPSILPPDFLRRLETLTLIARQAQRGQWQGERRSPKRGQSVEFADYRTYVPGDDFRLIDWNAYARLEKFFLKLFVEEEDLTVHLLLDTSRSMDWPPETTGQFVHKLTYARRAAAALGYIALTGLDRVTVSALAEANGSYFAPHRGRQHAFALFDFLEQVSTTDRIDLGQALARYATQARRPGPLLIFSDLFDLSASGATSSFAWADGVTALLARRFEVSLIHLLAPDEADPALDGDLRLLDSETGQAVEITADYEALTRYQTGLVTWQREIRRWSAQRNVTYVPVTTDVPFEAFVFTFLRHRGLLK